MRTKAQHASPMIVTLAVALSGLWAGAALAGSEGPTNVFYGTDAGSVTVPSPSIGGGTQNTFMGLAAGKLNSSGQENTYIGSAAGSANEVGQWNTFIGSASGRWAIGSGNTFVGHKAGYENTTGARNTFVGRGAGFNNTTGSRNVFIGFGAGNTDASSSDRLVIDSCDGSCNNPLISGQFDTHLLDINAEVMINANGQKKSQMHFSKDGLDVGGWITSALDNNFFLSSGTMYDGPGGGWIQKSPDGRSAIVGTQSADGYTVFLQQGLAVGAQINPALVPRLQVDYDGHVGLGKVAVPGRQIDVAGGAYLSTGGVWTNVSSRAAKENITELSGEEAMRALEELTPVTYNYKVDAQEKHVGFIAEDVPELVATQDRKGLSALDIVAVLTRAVQEKSRLLDEKSRMLDEQKERLDALTATVLRLDAELQLVRR